MWGFILIPPGVDWVWCFVMATGTRGLAILLTLFICPLLATVLPLFYSSETLYLAAFSAIKHCYYTQCSSVWGVREAYCSLTGSQRFGRFGAELSQQFLFFLHKDSSSLIKHSPSLCPILFFFLFPASWGLFFFVFLCFVLLHLIWGDSFSWNKVSFLPSAEAGFPTKGLGDRKNPGESTQCLLFLLLWQNHGDLWWIPSPSLVGSLKEKLMSSAYASPATALGSDSLWLSAHSATSSAGSSSCSCSSGLLPWVPWTHPPSTHPGDALLYNLHLLMDPVTLLDGQR